jgi:hypothetical protein
MNRYWNTIQKFASICSIWIKIDKKIACESGDFQHVYIIGRVEIKIYLNMFKITCMV